MKPYGLQGLKYLLSDPLQRSLLILHLYLTYSECLDIRNLSQDVNQGIASFHQEKLATEKMSAVFSAT